jgi:hypothetical protein
MNALRGTAIVIAGLLAARCAPPASSPERDEPQATRAERVAHTLGLPGARNTTPSVAGRGNLAIATWSAFDGETTRIYASTSQDAGRSFSQPVAVTDALEDVAASGEQPPRAVIVPATGDAEAPEIVILWTSRPAGEPAIRSARSLDGGMTFSPPRTVHDEALTGIRGWQSLAAAPDGTMHALWLDGRDAASVEPGASLGTPRQDVYLSTWRGVDPAVEQRLAIDVCFCCKTAVAADSRGTLFAAWRHIYPGSQRDIAVAASRDGGLSFEPPVRVSADGWQLDGCPDDGPALAVDSSDRIHVIWPTLIEEPGVEPRIGIFYAVSAHGRTFSPRQRIDVDGVTDPSHPQLVIDDDDGVTVVWDEVVQGARRIVMRQRTAGMSSFGSPIVVSRDGRGAYPVAAPVRDGLVIAWTSGSGDASDIALERVPVER